MVELFLLKAQKIIKKSYIDILSWVALGLTFFGYLIRRHYEGKPFFLSPDIYITALIFVLLVLYLMKFHNELKATIIVPIIFGLLALLKILNVIGFIGQICLFFNLIVNIIGFVVDAAFIIPCVLATISALKGLSRKLFVLIAMGVGIFIEVMLLIQWSMYARYYEGLYSIAYYSEILGSILLYITLLLFSIKYKIPAILSVSPEKEKKSFEKMSPEQSLKVLKDKLELGMITEEEYQSQRAEVISKL